MATEDNRYRQTSQFRLWSFSPSQLAELRSKTNALAKASIAERLTARNASSSSALASATASTSTSTPASGANTPQPTASEPDKDKDKDQDKSEWKLPEFLTPAEEQHLIDYYVVELLRAARFINDGTMVTSTAAIFLRRFYVTNSIMTYPPADMMKTCLFFGAKAEGVFHKLKHYVDKFPDTKKEDILAGEFVLSQGLRFSFDVLHPFRALEAAATELRRYGDVDEDRIAAAKHRALAILKFSSLLTDVYFHFSPSHIMLAALSLADRDLAERIIHETFSHAPGPLPAEGNRKKDDFSKERILGAQIRDKVLAEIMACAEMLAVEPPERHSDFWGKPESGRILKPLKAKLKKCHDPDRWDLVALQQAKREGTVKTKNASASLAEDGAVFNSADAGDPREAKRRKVSREAAEDPFGPSL